MAEKFVPRHSIGNEIRKKNDKSRFVGEFLSSDSPAGDDPLTVFRQVSMDDITPRFINKYRQSRIEQLASSIQNTNNRLIHPIVLVQASDLPATHEVRVAIEAQGKSISDYKYIIVSGERRFHAWQLLRQREAERIGNKIGIHNQFDTITANILSKTEAINEKAFYSDANNQARYLQNLRHGAARRRTYVGEASSPPQMKVVEEASSPPQMKEVLQVPQVISPLSIDSLDLLSPTHVCIP